MEFGSYEPHRKAIERRENKEKEECQCTHKLFELCLSVHELSLKWPSIVHRWTLTAKSLVSLAVMEGCSMNSN